jgi:ABC-type Zn uptake system ZnuABC Zn-binding protein ZnuA
MIRRSGAATAALFSRFVTCLAIVASMGLLPSGGAAAQERLKVVATTTDLRSLVEEVGGSRVEAISLVPSAVDAEEYQPKPQDIARLKDARLLVRVGLDFDLWVDKLLTTAGNARLMRGAEGYVDASAAIAVLDVRGVSLGAPAGHAHGSGNPHYWLDPKNAEVITGHILEGLARVDPEHAKIYEANRLVFLNRLDAKLREWDARIAPVRGTPVVAYHNTWAYFARRFPDRLRWLHRAKARSPCRHSASGRSVANDARAARATDRSPAARATTRRGISGTTHGCKGCRARGLGRRAAGDWRLLFPFRYQRCCAGGGGLTVTDALALLWAPFLVALCLVGIHTYFGIQVLVRNVIFVDLALAQVAALGTTVAFMLGHAIPSPAAYAYSLAFTLLAALLLAFTRTWSGRIPQEALIGIIYVVTAAAAILLIDRAPQGAEHLKQILTGNVLTTGLSELTAIVPLYVVIGLLHWMLRRRRWQQVKVRGPGSFFSMRASAWWSRAPSPLPACCSYSHF